MSVLLIREAPSAEYGYYVLAITTILVLSTVQNAFLQAPLVLALTRSTADEQRALLAGTIRLHRRMLAVAATVAVVLAGVILIFGELPRHEGLIISAGIAAVLATLFREFFRMLLMVRHHAAPVVLADIVFSALLLLGVALATRTSTPAALSLGALASAGAIAGVLLVRTLFKHEQLAGVIPRKGLLSDFAPTGAWSAIGSTTHWSFSQGYNYIAVALIDVTAVAALAATRVALTPINLLSSGIAPLLFPAASRWLRDSSGTAVLRRLLGIASGIALLAVTYILVLWFSRDWLFSHVLDTSFEQRDLLILAWVPVFLVMVFRDQMVLLPGAAGQFRQMALVTFFGAAVALGVTYFSISEYGVVGGPMGVLCGEVLNLAGMIWLSWSKIRSGRRSQSS